MPNSTILKNGPRPLRGVGIISLFVFSLCLFQLHGQAAEPFRPHYHFTPEKNWINDPNGLVFLHGEYHLFCQYNPFGDKWGHMSWGHAISRDLVHWEELPVALGEADGIMIFSGSALVDWHNTSAFGNAGRPPLVAIYTGHRTADGRQAQCLASSTDRGRSWTKFSGNPVLDVDSNNFRDPKVFWHEPTKHWIMVVSMAEQRRIRFYGSTNLKQWTHLSEFGPAGATNGVWECPDMFPLPVEGHPGRAVWILIVNIGSGSAAGGSGTQYFIGQFDGQSFKIQGRLNVSEEPRWADYGRDCYAAVSWSDIPKSDGRRILLGWMSNWEYAQDVPTSPWRNAMAIPRELSVRDTGDGLRLIQRPVRELRQLRQSRRTFSGGSVLQANQWLTKKHIAGNSLEMNLVFEPGRNGQCGVRLFKGDDGQTVVGFDEVSKRVFVDRTHSGNVSFHKAFPGIYHAQSRLRDGRLKLNLFIDACSLEVFVNDGELVFTDLVFPSQSSRGIEFFARASGAVVSYAEAWELQPAFPGRE